MNPYNTRLPNFTAEASLAAPKSARERLTYSSKNYPMQDIKVLHLAANRVNPHTWCDEETPCDPVTRTKTICRWREDIGDTGDCVCSSRSCKPPCSCYNSMGHPVPKTASDCLSSGYSWCCYDPKTDIGSCTIA